MPFPRVVVLPRLDDESVVELVSALAELLPIDVVSVGSVGAELPENQWLAAVALGVARSGAAFEGVHFVALGATVERLPALAFAQRAARRPVLSYVCVDAVPSGQFVDWPDAPVTLVKTDPLLLADVTSTARLRGWMTVSTTDGETAAAIAEAIRESNP